MITIGDLGGFGGTSDITSFLNVASPTPLGVGAGPSLERGGVSFHAPHNVRLRRAQSGGNEVVSRCNRKPRPQGQSAVVVRLLRIGRGCLARRAIVASRRLALGKEKAPR